MKDAPHRALRFALLLLAIAACAPELPVVEGDLPVAEGLREGAPVSYRGIAVGAVERITFGPAGVHVRIRLARRDVPLRRDDRLRVAAVGLFGDRALTIVPGPLDAPLLAPGGVLAAEPADTLDPVRDAIARAALQRAIDSLASMRAKTGARRGR